MDENLSVNTIQQTIWMEKYRPKTLDDIALNPIARAELKKYIDAGEYDHLFLCSRPGQGKTSLAKLLPEIFQSDALYINASDENNVETMRNTVKNFAYTMSTNGRFKTVILDECDGCANMQAQKILRRLMEEVTDNTRFIIVANYKERIIEAIQSRCFYIDITPDKNEIGRVLCKILSKENEEREVMNKERTGVGLPLLPYIEINQDTLVTLKQLIKYCYPDVRSMVKHLQHSIQGSQVVLPEYIETGSFAGEIFERILTYNQVDVRKYVIEHEDAFNADYVRLLDDLYHLMIESTKLDNEKHAQWTLTISDYMSKMATSFDQELTFSACIFSLMNTLK